MYWQLRACQPTNQLLGSGLVNKTPTPAALHPAHASSFLQDDFYLRHLIKNNLLDPVMDAFFANGDRYNLLNSAVLEMVEFIRKENLKVCVCLLVCVRRVLMVMAGAWWTWGTGQRKGLQAAKEEQWRSNLHSARRERTAEQGRASSMRAAFAVLCLQQAEQ
jgi:hypothetical protein